MGLGRFVCFMVSNGLKVILDQIFLAHFVSVCFNDVTLFARNLRKCLGSFSYSHIPSNEYYEQAQKAGNIVATPFHT